ncbi:hypothetical protein HK098_003733 [Nowakowskiella sp. JEL0407]|nr:hypothetical protein HK098_003733 [Nowakowskiella sp. JEL0407]
MKYSIIFNLITLCVLAQVAAATTTVSSTRPTAQQILGGPSGSGRTTSFLDCCKPNCSRSSTLYGRALGSVKSCASVGSVLANRDIKNGCAPTGVGETGTVGDGFAYMCTDYQPWVINDQLSYGFAATYISQLDTNYYCCACFELTFTTGPVKGKQMIIPGAGINADNACSKQFTTDANTWGARYGGVTKIEQCSVLPASFRLGCERRFKWFKNADNPYFRYREVVCPAEIANISG